MDKLFYVKNYTGSNDDERIAACLEDAYKVQNATVIFDGKDYEISKAILIDSGMSIIVDGCMIKQKDGTFDNVFRGRNIHLDSENPMNPALKIDRMENVKIVGRNHAIIEGCDVNRRAYHPVMQEEQDMVGDAWGFLTQQILFCMTDHFEIAGLCLRKTRGYGITIDLCSDFHIHDLELYSNVSNGDGIHVLSGCHNAVIERIKGFTSDDVVALRSGYRQDEFPTKKYLAPLYTSLCEYEKRTLEELGIHDITIRDIKCGGEMHGIINLPLNGTVIENIQIENIEDVERGKDYFATVFLYTGLYGEIGYFRNISVKNVNSLADTAFVSNSSIENLTLSNINRKNKDGKLYGTFRHGGIYENVIYGG